MFDRERTLYDFMLGYCRLLVKDIDEARMAEQPAPGINHPAWILTHLAICTDYAGQLLGLSPACPKEWHKSCGPGSKLTTNRADYAGKDELIRALQAGHERVSLAVANATQDQLDAPHPFKIEILKKFLPTTGQMLAHLMTTHPGIHLGQLSTWRRIIGLPGVIPI